MVVTVRENHTAIKENFVELTELEKAERFAIKAHENQKYGQFPYIKHLYDVQNVLIRFGYGSDTNYLVAALLHDIIEDTDYEWHDISSEYGYFVANLVDSVSGYGKNRRERLFNVANKLVKFPQGVPLKLADRIANIEQSLLRNNDKLSMYLKEHSSFMILVPKFANDHMFEHLQYLQQLGTLALGIRSLDKIMNPQRSNR
ncbi:MAG TPA: hypothetical protein DGG95_12635 [Cytophagales bacterium]|jgi:(p)ppGpp synthase/HD superfamily hydrolase|nr:hypothetical protein [Cytophagales bacterium]